MLVYKGPDPIGKMKIPDKGPDPIGKMEIPGHIASAGEDPVGGHRAGQSRFVQQRPSTRLRYLAVTENRSVQALLAEAIDLLLQARGLATRDAWPFYVPAARRR